MLKHCSCVFALLLLLCPAAFAGEALPAVVVPAGETSLMDVGLARVWWQSYGKEPVGMPLGWADSDSHSGIACVERGRVEGHRVLFMHSPWRVPPGKTWIDYPLVLPKAGTIRLAFGIAMSAEAAAPGKSDGVTFSCVLLAGQEAKELMRRHHTKAEWSDESFDLAAYAGQSVVVRLQVEPGPKNDSAFDFSYFGDPRIIAGDASGEGERSAALRRVTDSRAYKAVAGCDLAALSNAAGNGVVPSNLLPGKNRLEQAGDGWRFIYEGEDCRVVYTYGPATGTLDDFVVQVDDGRAFVPASGGGATIVVASGGKMQEMAARGGKAVRISAAGASPSLEVVWEYPAADKPVRLAWTYRIAGKALVISARCEEPVVARFSLGELGPVALRRRMAVPYLPGSVVHLPAENLFVARCLDWTVSHASRCPEGQATYESKTDSARNPLVETGYVAVSPDVGEVLPNIPHPPSPYLAQLGPRIMLDIWGHHKGTYRGDAENLRMLKDNGVDHVAIISHVWQRYGYDVKLPDHLPADPSYGGDAGMIEFGRAANECGYIWSLHENYIDLYPDSPSYDAAARVLLADGSPSKAWYNAGTRVQSFGLKCNRAMDFAKLNAPEIHRRFGTTAGYLDVHSSVPPWHQLDHEANQPLAAMELAKVQNDTRLFQYMRQTHGGPILGEGHNHFYWAGRCDGVEAQVDGGEDHAPLPDFDLLKIHPQMVNHGMGYYERWFRRGVKHTWGYDTGNMEQIDKYRAQELAYGHAGFVGGGQVDNVQWVVREHHLMHPIQRLYGTAKPTGIRYEVDGRLVTASAALAAGNTMRQRIQYQGGLSLWANWGTEPWQVEGRVLPQWGFLALGPGTQVSTASRGGRIADYAECPEYLFADARTSIAMPYLHPKKEIEPRLRSFKHLGGNKVEVSYEWIVDDTLDEDFQCFVHGVAAAGPEPDRVVFQQDHALPRPTSQWRKGERIVDGPFTIQLPDKMDGGTLVIGLHKGRRVQLKGTQKGDNRIEIARCSFVRKDGAITEIRAEKIVAAPPVRDLLEADFSARLNPPGTWIDFGKVATDGSVMIRREPERLVIFPYPRERTFGARLDLAALAPEAVAGRVRIEARASGTAAEIGPVSPEWENGRLVLKFGAAGVGRYVVTWK